ncbi:MAG: ATP-binding protein [Clostridia bacterium]|nr:ATP-binding protein [Clostridia bacterium]
MDFKVFGGLLKDDVTKALLSGENFDAYTGKIIEFAELEAVTDSILVEYIVTRLADDENVLSHLLGEGRSIGKSLKTAVMSDLEQLITVFDRLYSYDYIPSDGEKYYCGRYISSVKAMVSAVSAKELYDLLTEHYRTLGTGIYARYTALLCSKDGISGIEKPDSTDFSALIGLEHIKKILSDNAELFLAGERANNVLLFGDRGTGKSSCVKALLNKYADQGLRVIELPKNCITLIPDLYKELAKRPQKFILYLDDLSFEKHEPEYRSLKVSMEGQLGSIPQNVLIFATSNRRHLIKENWKDREGGDVHAGDNMQEMLSLSERFGISLVFSAPNQREYLDIVGTLLARKGIEMTEEIEKKAIAWQMNYGGRTPRCASQFVAAYRKE